MFLNKYADYSIGTMNVLNAEIKHCKRKKRNTKLIDDNKRIKNNEKKIEIITIYEDSDSE